MHWPGPPFRELGLFACRALPPLLSLGSRNSPVTKFLSTESSRLLRDLHLARPCGHER